MTDATGTHEVWIAETLYPDWGQRFLVVRGRLPDFTSPFQHIEISRDVRATAASWCWTAPSRSPSATSSCTRRCWCTCRCWPTAHARNVLIIGAGDGGVLRRVLEHGGVARAVMVEIDAEVIRLARAFLPDIAGGAWDDPRAEVIVGDGIDYVRGCEAASFDAIIVDSTDPVGVGETLFSDAFYRDAARCLSPDGLIVNQSGVPFMQAAELRETSLRRARFFPHVGAYVAAVPTYVGGFMTLGFASKRPGIGKVDAATLRERAQAAGMLGRTRYWSPEVHAAAFALPPYIAADLPG